MIKIIILLLKYNFTINHNQLKTVSFFICSFVKYILIIIINYLLEDKSLIKCLTLFVTSKSQIFSS